MLRICIGGFSSSGKTTLGRKLSRELKVLHITKGILNTYKEFKTQNRGRETSGINIIQTMEKKYANSFDDEVIRLAARNNCVVSTWLGPWLVKSPTVNVWLNASFEQRSRRRAKDKGIGLKAAKAYIEKKDRLTLKAFKEIYKINANDRSRFDIELNTEKLSRKEMISLISMLALQREKLTFR